MHQPHRGLAAISVGLMAAAGIVAAPFAATAAEAGIRINEAESSGGIPGDWVELYNASSTAIDLSGYVFRDGVVDGTHDYVIPAATVVEPGGYLVLDELIGGVGNFDFGLGSGDSAQLLDATGALVDAQSWTAHGDPTWGVTPDGLWAQTSAPTKGAANVFPDPEPPADAQIALNEVDSSPADWVELFNAGDAAFDLSGYEIRDNSDDHRWFFPAGASVPASGYLVVDSSTVGLIYDDVDGDGSLELVEGEFGSPIGIGSADEIRLFDPSGAEVDRTGAWTGHPAIDGDEIAATRARCPDGEGEFVLAYATQGAANTCVPPALAINEVESNGDATDWVEIINTGTSAIDLSGWTLMDNDPVGHAADVTPVPAGTLLEPGARFVFDQNVHFAFGLGSADQATVRDAGGATVVEYVWAAHAAGVYARCPEGTGEFSDIAVSTKGAPNDCGTPARINEVESSGGDPGDWVELVNPTASAIDISGLVVSDNDDTHLYTIPAGTTLAAGAYVVIDESALGFGLGSADSARLFDVDATTLLDSTSWTSHAAVTWGRCPDTVGAFEDTQTATKGAANLCVGDIPVSTWPGSAEVTVLDETPTFLEDSSGLDGQETAEGTVLWAVDNGTGRFWKLRASADGSVQFADGWESGKRARFVKDAANPAAEGPDAEGITVDGDGWVYLASERDNDDSGVNQNVVLKIDPDAAGPDIVASQEWDLTSLLPAVGANLGVEAVEWVPDTALAGSLWDAAASAPYDPAAYPGHGDGLFFVAVEDEGHVFAFALAEDGSATLVTEIDPGLGGAMGLDYDSALGVLWAVCDDGCEGETAQVTLNGTAAPGVAHFARPAGMENLNNEGFATAPASLSIDGDRPVWWFADGFSSGSLRVGTLPGGDLSLVVGTPTVSGSPVVGRTLTADPGTWTDGAALSYEWLRDGSPIDGATASVLTVSRGLAGASISVRVTGVLDGFVTASATSDPVGPVLKEMRSSTPRIMGLPKKGWPLIAIAGAWTRGADLDYQWFADGEPIPGATRAFYVPTRAVVGARLTVEVTGSKAGYETVTETSRSTARVLR